MVPGMYGCVPLRAAGYARGRTAMKANLCGHVTYQCLRQQTTLRAHAPQASSKHALHTLTRCSESRSSLVSPFPGGVLFFEDTRTKILDLWTLTLGLIILTRDEIPKTCNGIPPEMMPRRILVSSKMLAQTLPACADIGRGILVDESQRDASHDTGRLARGLLLLFYFA